MCAGWRHDVFGGLSPSSATTIQLVPDNLANATGRMSVERFTAVEVRALATVLFKHKSFQIMGLRYIVTAKCLS